MFSGSGVGNIPQSPIGGANAGQQVNQPGNINPAQVNPVLPGPGGAYTAIAAIHQPQ